MNTEKKTVGPEQLLQLFASLCGNVDMSALDFDQVQAAIKKPKGPGAEFVKLVNGGWQIVQVVGSISFDLDADPFLYDGETIEEVDGIKQHEKGGTFLFDGSKIDLYLTDEQKKGGKIDGASWLHRQKDMSGFNATMIDCLFENQDNPVVAAFLTPLRDKALFATKTVLRRSVGDRFVRGLFFDGERWFRRDDDLRFDWLSYDLALRPASKPSDS